MRVKLTITYDGTNYCGWQVQPQPECVTIQQVIENAIEIVTKEKVRVTGSGRTDAGVHAIGQVAHFDTNSTVPAEKFYMARQVMTDIVGRPLAIMFYLLGFRGSYHRMGGTAILEKIDGDEIVERIEAPAMWEQMCFKPDRIK